MSTEELAWVFVTYPRVYEIHDMELACWLSDIEEELISRPNAPSVIRSWVRLMRLERQHLRVERQRLGRLYNNAMEAQFYSQ